MKDIIQCLIDADYVRYAKDLPYVITHYHYKHPGADMHTPVFAFHRRFFCAIKTGRTRVESYNMHRRDKRWGYRAFVRSSSGEYHMFHRRCSTMAECYDVAAHAVQRNRRNGYDVRMEHILFVRAEVRDDQSAIDAVLLHDAFTHVGVYRHTDRTPPRYYAIRAMRFTPQISLHAAIVIMQSYGKYDSIITPYDAEFPRFPA